jgi:hypothetical protein
MCKANESHVDYPAVLQDPNSSEGGQIKVGLGWEVYRMPNRMWAKGTTEAPKLKTETR